MNSLDRPSAKTRRWLVSALCPGGRVIATRVLRGGTTSSVHAVTVVDRMGQRLVVVLRQWPGGDSSQSIANEVEVLQGLESCDVPAPQVLAAADDVDGRATVVMSKLGGRMELAPPDIDDWSGKLAAMLPRIHACPPVGLDRRFPESIPRDRPSWIRDAGLWKAVESILGTPPPVENSFIHGDFQHFNLLWTRGQLTGVVDWTWSGIGSPDRDVSHCRLNLAVLFSADVADRFAAAYQANSGRSISAWWDVWELVKYDDGWPLSIPKQVAGRTAVDLVGMSARVETLLARALNRAGG